LPTRQRLEAEAGIEDVAVEAVEGAVEAVVDREIIGSVEEEEEDTTMVAVAVAEVDMEVDTVMVRRPLAMVVVVEAMAVDMVEVEAEVDGGKPAFLPLASEVPGNLAILDLRPGKETGARLFACLHYASFLTNFQPIPYRLVSVCPFASSSTTTHEARPLALFYLTTSNDPIVSSPSSLLHAFVGLTLASLLP
jgi:hypothetical protein